VGYYNTFVVKVWCNNGGEMIRGHIQHISTQGYMYFSNLEDTVDFITSHLGRLPDNSVTQDKMHDGLTLLAEGIGDIGQDG